MEYMVSKYYGILVFSYQTLRSRNLLARGSFDLWSHSNLEFRTHRLLDSLLILSADLKLVIDGLTANAVGKPLIGTEYPSSNFTSIWTSRSDKRMSCWNDTLSRNLGRQLSMGGKSTNGPGILKPVVLLQSVLKASEWGLSRQQITPDTIFTLLSLLGDTACGWKKNKLARSSSATSLIRSFVGGCMKEDSDSGL